MEIIDSSLRKKSNPSPIRLGSDTNPKYINREDFLDEKKRKMETDDIFQQMQNAADLIQKTLSPQESLQWGKTTSETLQISDAETSLRDKIGIKSGGKENLFIISLVNIFDASESVLHYNSTERLRKIAKVHENTDQLQTVIRLSHFMTDLDIRLKVGGTSILDIVNSQDVTANSFYKSSVEAAIAVHDTSVYDSILQENQNPLTAMYPNEAKSHISRAVRFLTSITDITPELLEQMIKFYIPNPAGKEQTILKTAQRIIEQSSNTKEKIFSTLFDPNSSEFEALRNTIMFYFSKKDVRLKTIALHKLGLNSMENISKAYRKTKELALQNNEHSAFYILLEESIREHLANTPEEIGILTSDDLPLFIDRTTPIQEKSTPTFEDLAELNAAIFQKTSQRKFDVDTDLIHWKNLIPPTSVNLDFPKGHARIFNLQLYYENEQGESLILNLEFDTAKNVFDWKPFLESPDDPQMTELRRVALFASHSILSQIQQQTEAVYQQKQKERQAKTQMPQATIRQPHPKEPYVPREKVAREKPTRPLSPIQEILQSEMPLTTQPKQQEIKNQIVITNIPEFGKKMGSLSSEDALLVSNGIEEYNERSVGQFKMLKALGKDKERLYTLRVNCGTGGGIRILMHETPSPTEANMRSFEILDIGYRKDVYRKRGL